MATTGKLQKFTLDSDQVVDSYLIRSPSAATDADVVGRLPAGCWNCCSGFSVETQNQKCTNVAKLNVMRWTTTFVDYGRRYCEQVKM